MLTHKALNNCFFKCLVAFPAGNWMIYDSKTESKPSVKLKFWYCISHQIHLIMYWADECTFYMHCDGITLSVLSKTRLTPNVSIWMKCSWFSNQYNKKVLFYSFIFLNPGPSISVSFFSLLVLLLLFKVIFILTRGLKLSSGMPSRQPPSLMRACSESLPLSSLWGLDFCYKKGRRLNQPERCFGLTRRYVIRDTLERKEIVL